MSSAAGAAGGRRSSWITAKLNGFVLCTPPWAFVRCKFHSGWVFLLSFRVAWKRTTLIRCSQRIQISAQFFTFTPKLARQIWIAPNWKWQYFYTKGKKAKYFTRISQDARIKTSDFPGHKSLTDIFSISKWKKQNSAALSCKATYFFLLRINKSDQNKFPASRHA